jgi:hypothetical protein
MGSAIIREIDKVVHFTNLEWQGDDIDLRLIRAFTSRVAQIGYVAEGSGFWKTVEQRARLFQQELVSPLIILAMNSSACHTGDWPLTVWEVASCVGADQRN